ncbi:MAG: hypothetical protein ACFBSG_06685 [Leptolyngbyaceae cyanobacterium]
MQTDVLSLGIFKLTSRIYFYRVQLGTDVLLLDRVSQPTAQAEIC